MVSPGDAHLIGLDWGSSSLRAVLIDGTGHIVESRYSNAGASTLSGGGQVFSSTLDGLISDWHSTSCPVVACGMVGSTHGWREVPYASCPAQLPQLAASALTVDWRGRTVTIVPGLRFDAETPDVMRGEETQVVGALALHPELSAQACIVMPGTHSKWAHVRDGVVDCFATQMTGEFFALLRKHSVLGRLMEPDVGYNVLAFARGVRYARDQGERGVLNQLFSVRTLGLTGQLGGDALPDYLSGLLIGHELYAGLRWRESVDLATAPLVLIGEGALCQRYVKALDLFGQRALHVLPNTAAAGLWSINQHLESLKK